MAQRTSIATLISRLFIVLALLLTLTCTYAGYRYVSRLQHENNYYHTDTFYRTVRDSVAHSVKPEIIYVKVPTAPSNTAQLQALQAAVARLEAAQGRANNTLSKLTPPRPTATVKQPTVTVALADTVMRRRTETGKLVVTKAKTGTFRDPWLSLTGVVIPGQNGKPDSLQAKYMVRNDFDVNVYSEREGKHKWYFWKPRKVYVDLKNKNPNATTTKMEHLKVEKK